MKVKIALNKGVHVASVYSGCHLVHRRFHALQVRSLLAGEKCRPAFEGGAHLIDLLHILL
jgi:hypothetical protein